MNHTATRTSPHDAVAQDHQIDAGRWTGLSELYYGTRQSVPHRGYDIDHTSHLHSPDGDTLCHHDTYDAILGPVPIQQPVKIVVPDVCGHCLQKVESTGFQPTFDGDETNGKATMTVVDKGIPKSRSVLIAEALEIQRRVSKDYGVAVIEQVDWQ